MKDRRTGGLALAVTGLALLSAIAGVPSVGAQTVPPADMVLRGGVVYTVDADGSVAEAVAITDGRIVYVGDDVGAQAYVGADTQQINLAGRMLMPGIHDAHAHPLSAGQGLRECSLDYAALTIEETKSVISACLQETVDQEPDGWLTVLYWDFQGMLPTGTIPSRADLDELATSRPIIVFGLDGHQAWVNSRALELAGVDASTPDPPDGEIVRDAEGDPTGLLFDGAIGLVARLIPSPTLDDDADSLEEAMVTFLEQGITSFLDAATGRRDLRVYARMNEQVPLTPRESVAVVLSERDLTRLEATMRYLRGLEAGFDGDRLWVRTVKLFFDGVIEFPTQTAALLRPYRVNAGTERNPDWVFGKSRGRLYFEPEIATRGIGRLDRAGWQVHVHAIGDRAVRTALDAFEVALEENGPSDLPHAIAHLELVHPADVRRFDDLGVVADMQLQWAERDPYTIDALKPYIGPARWRHLYPAGSLLRAGATLAGGSDWPVDPLNPWRQIEQAVTRELGVDYYDGYAGALGPDEAISLEDAIAMHTIGGAIQLGRQDETGSIEVGKLADVIVLDRNLLEIPIQDVSETQVLLTLIGGEIAHGVLTV